MASIAQQPTSSATATTPADLVRVRKLASLFAAATGLSLLATGLLAEGRLGFGFLIFSLATTVSALLLGHRHSRASAETVTPILLALVFAGFLAWRDSVALSVLNFAAIAALIGFATLPFARKTQVGVRDLLGRVPAEWVGYLGSALPVLTLGGEASKVMKGEHLRQLSAVLRGLAIACPLLLAYGLLFSSADAGFEHLMSSLTSVKVDDLFRYGIVFALSLPVLSGFLHRLIFPVLVPPVTGGRDRVGNPTEVATILVTLNLLFGLFVATQFRHLFGGMQVVQTSPNLLVSEYARRGFFELVCVAFLTMVVLLGTHSFVPKDLTAQRIYRSLASVMLVLVLLVMQSAFQRMQLYTATFGTTELRLYVLASMGWLALVFVTFACTVLTGRKQFFASVSAVAGLMLVFFLNLINHDGQIVRINTSRPKVDISYLSTLSADAIPDLVAVLPTLGVDDQSKVKQLISERSAEYRRADWRSRNLSSYVADKFAEDLRKLETP